MLAQCINTIFFPYRVLWVRIFFGGGGQFSRGVGIFWLGGQRGSCTHPNDMKVMLQILKKKKKKTHNKNLIDGIIYIL